jgi:GNAT superfamily N-acetyltransferase
MVSRVGRISKLSVASLAATRRCVDLITCRKMTFADVSDAFRLLSAFLRGDEHYLASSKAYGDRGLQGLNDSLDLFLERPELGFIWMAYDEGGVAGMCVICYAISTSMGAVVAKLDDVSVKEDRRGKGVGTALVEQLKEQLRKESVTRIDVAVHLENPEARRFYEKLGFVALNEERLACVI